MRKTAYFFTHIRLHVDVLDECICHFREVWCIFVCLFVVVVLFCFFFVFFFVCFFQF